MRGEDFLSEVSKLAWRSRELMNRVARTVEPTPDLGCALGAMAAACNILDMLSTMGIPDGWQEIPPCPECNDTNQHRIGCSHDDAPITTEGKCESCNSTLAACNAVTPPARKCCPDCSHKCEHCGRLVSRVPLEFGCPRCPDVVS